MDGGTAGAGPAPRGTAGEFGGCSGDGNKNKRVLLCLMNLNRPAIVKRRGLRPGWRRSTAAVRKVPRRDRWSCCRCVGVAICFVELNGGCVMPRPERELSPDEMARALEEIRAGWTAEQEKSAWDGVKGRPSSLVVAGRRDRTRRVSSGK
ncbi:hypothetical protein UFOVP1124_48 [uncultured Caudovirales phage]|uniref:Uncharacterized protein n=1 Tax=uncultured Caudovirales phage TaxID=2100421 RepID=A0A6J5QVZ7_9CAUD|nr:hypothetical protein UFOVP1124_48 [uncultured Caudovirales phage]